MSRQITIQEVKKHKRKSSVWIIIHNDVYDVTSFLGEHPGGEDSLTAFAGKDGTQVFDDVNHSEDAKELMKKYKIGTLPLEQQKIHVDPCFSSRSKCSICSASSRSDPVKSDSKKSKNEPKAEKRLGAIVVPSECSIPPRHCSFSYKWLLLALAGAIVLGAVLKKHLAR